MSESALLFLRTKLKKKKSKKERKKEGREMVGQYFTEISNGRVNSGLGKG